MRYLLRGWLTCLLCGLVGMVAWASVAQADESLSGVVTVLSGPLVVPSAEPLVEGQVAAAEEAARSNPEAVSQREASETAYENLGPAAAENVANTDFLPLMDEPDGGPPRLPEGERISGFVNAYAAQVDLGGGSEDQGIVESSVPMAVDSGQNKWMPVDLGLHEVSGGFEPASPLVGVRLPKRLAEGAGFSSLGLSVIPLDGQGLPVGGSEGVIDGASVFFANALTDMDIMMKASSRGFTVDALLRSVNSPEVLSFRVGLPVGASLYQAATGTGPVEVRDAGQVVGTISIPSAVDAEGMVVPLTFSVSGDVLRLTVKHPAGRYRFPIVVDPEYNEITEAYPIGSWQYTEAPGGGYALMTGLPEMVHEGAFAKGDWAVANMVTKGDSKIYKLTVTDAMWPYTEKSGEQYTTWLSSWLEIDKVGVESHPKFVSGHPLLRSASVCANEACSPAGGVEANGASFAVTTLESSEETLTHYGEHNPSFGVLFEPTKYIGQPKETHTIVGYNNLTQELEYTSEGKAAKALNVFYGGGGWLGPHSGAFQFIANDAGLGVSATSVEIKKGSEWIKYLPKNYLIEEHACLGVQCNAYQYETVTYSMLSGGLINGNNTIRVSGHDPMAKTSSTEYGEGEATLKVDSTAPHGITVSGLSVKGEELELGEVEGHLKAEATDGEGSVPSSGIRQLTLSVDGREVGKPAGSCPLGPCTASGEWALNGAELGTGTHILTVAAIDNAGNAATKKVVLDVYHASPVAMGPGSVNPESGNFALEADDVDLSGGMGPLTVARHYDSRNLTEGREGPFGPQWTISLGSLASLEVLPDESVMVIGPEGLTHFSKITGGGFEAPMGDSSLKLELKGSEYILENKAKGTTTKFTLPTGAKSWMPTTSTGLVATDTATDEYQTVEPELGKKIVQPTFELAPHPAATCVREKLAAGCRALEFVYSTTLTAKGESQNEWGEYSGRLKEVLFSWYNATKGLTEKVAVAQYEYDIKGRLRAAWDPRISPALKTTYGYDAEGHITAISSPGQQPWVATYGTIHGDLSTGRLLSMTRPSAATALGSGEATTNTVAPVMSTKEPEVGVRLSVSTGTWSASPISYGYQWEDCDASGIFCAPIAGATNSSYVPVSSDAYYALVAVVTATNRDGTVSVSTVASNKVPSLDYEREIGTTGESEGQLKNPEGVATDSKGNVWVADTGNNRIEEFSPTGAYLGRFGSLGTGNGQLNKPHGIEIDKKGDFYVTDTGNNRIEEFNEEEKYLRQFNTGLNKPAGIALDTTGNVWVTNPAGGTLDMVVEFSPEGERLREWGYSGELLPGWFKNPQGITVGATGTIWVADTGNNKLQACNQEGSCQYSGSPGSGIDQFTAPGGIATDGSGNLWVADTGNNRIQELTSTGSYDQQLGSKGTGNKQLEGPAGLGLDASGNLYVADTKNNRITKWAVPSTEAGPPEPPNPGTNSVSTIEYGVPLSGSGVGLQNLTAGEVAKWGQKDDPVEATATAIFPPDKVMGWPALNYKRATVMYFDTQARLVNTVTPSGGVSTTEYNEDNDIERTLSAANRATALKEANPAESAKLLDTESKYTNEGTELAETIGPQHLVKLAGSGEVQARNHTRYFYDEGAPEGQQHGLVTRTIDSALVAGKDEEPRTTRTYYSGQNGLGWTVRQPTSVAVDPGGLNLVHTTKYNETGNVVETKAPAGSVESVFPPVFSTSLGSEGSGSGQFNHPEGTAVDLSGNLWVDDKNNHRLQEFSPSGSFMGAFGSEGSGEGQFKEAWGIALDKTTGNIVVSDTGNNRIDVFSSTGKFLRMFGSTGAGNGQLKEPNGLTVDSKGDVWVADLGNNRIEEFSSTGAYVSQFGAKGTGNGQFLEPTGVAISEGQLYVTDLGNDRVQEFTTAGAYLAKFGSEGSGQGQFKGPEGIAVNPASGVLYVSDLGNQRVEEFSGDGKYLAAFGTYGAGAGQFHGPTGLTVGPTGKIYIADQYNARIDEWLPPEAGGARMLYSTSFGSEGSGEGQFSQPWGTATDASGNIWVSDYNNGRIEKLSPAGKFLASYGTKGSGSGQFTHPTGIAINQSTGNVYVGDCGNNRIEELNSTGGFVRTFGSAGTEPGHLSCMDGVKIDPSGNVWVADTHNNRVQEFSATGTFIATYGSFGTGNAQFSEPGDIAFSGGNLYVVDTSNDRVQELSMTGTYITQFGYRGSDSGQFKSPEAIVTDASGNLYVLDNENGRVEEFKPSGTYLATFASPGNGEGQLSNPLAMAINAAGDIYIADGAHNRIQIWAPADQAVHDTKTIYYTAKNEAEVSTCQNHPEWVTLVCETLPAMQPETSELPPLPATTIKYNVWDEPEVITEAFGSTTRTKTTSFDPAGRAITSEVTAGIDAPVPAVTDKYDAKTGALAEESTTVAGKTKTIKDTINTLGQLEQYTDADGSTTTYKHDIDGRVTEVANVIETGGKKEATWQKYSYDETSGFMIKLEDSAAGTFTANRDVTGRITSATYPNAMTASDTYNSVGETTSIRYEKTAHCATTCPETWFKETVTPSIHGETVERVNTLTTDAYVNDPAGRLTQVQETPAGKGCVTRIYAYDEESDRTSLTSRNPGTEGKCATEGGTTEAHRYDPANRLIDNGVSYETFGNTTKLPGADAGGPEMEIKTEYYTDNQAANQTQNGKTYKYYMDPAGRVRETKTEVSGKIVGETISHYAGSGSALAWTSEEEGKAWTRNIPGIDGSLTAIQSSSGTITLQLHDLQGNVVDTASDLETQTKILTSYNSTEFGTPLNGPPPTKYSWLGATGVSSEQTTGLITQDGLTYVPQTGRPLQTQGLTLPTPDNTATPYVTMFETGIGAATAAAAAQQAANAEQARKALEGANGSPGLITSEEFGSECSGSNACASSRISCKITLMFGEPAPNLLFAGSSFTCSKRVLDFELQVVILVESHPECGASCGFENLKKNQTPDGHLGEIFENTSSGRAHAVVEYCAEGIGYRAWTWGRVFGSHNFVSKGQETGIWRCSGEGSHDFYGELIDAGYELEP